MPSETSSSASGKPPNTKVVQVSNISPIASREQIYQLFSYLGKIDEIRVYPQETNPMYASLTQKLAYVKYDEASAVATAQHITNTVFIDRALICVPILDGKIPDEDTALKTGGPAWPGQRQLPPNVLNQIQTVGDQQVVMTIDPTLAALGLPAYPSLPANTDASKIEEIRRTVYVGNIPKSVEPEETMQFFNDMIGEVMYLRMAGSENLSTRYAYIEFSNQHSVPTALQNDGIEFKGNKLLIQHSRVAIIKPQAKTQDMAKREIQEALKKQQTVGLGMPGSLTTSALNRGLEADVARKVSSRSRSRSPPLYWSSRFRKSRSPSPVRRRSRSKDKYGSRSRYGGTRSREKRSRSKERREMQRSKERRRRSKSKEREKESSRKRTSPSVESKSKREKERGRTRDKDDKRRSDRDKEREKDKKSDSKKDDKKLSGGTSAEKTSEKSSKTRDEFSSEKKQVKKEVVGEESEEEKRRKEEELREVDEILEQALGRKEVKKEIPESEEVGQSEAVPASTMASEGGKVPKTEPKDSSAGEEDEEEEKMPATEILSAVRDREIEKEREAFAAWKRERRRQNSSSTTSSEENKKTKERKRKRSRSRSVPRRPRSRSRSETLKKREKEKESKKRRKEVSSDEEAEKKSRSKDKRKRKKEKESKSKKKRKTKKESSGSSVSSSDSDLSD